MAKEHGASHLNGLIIQESTMEKELAYFLYQAIRIKEKAGLTAETMEFLLLILSPSNLKSDVSHT